MNAEPNSEQILKAALLASQNWWEDMGVDIPDLPPAAKTKKTTPATKQPAKQTRPAPVKNQQPVEPDLSDRIGKITAQAKAATSLEALKQVITDIDAGALSDNARNIVFARGNPDADIMVIGETPGAQEDEAGKPFIGPAGQLLDKMLGAIGLGEDKTYITNICNWRPPANRALTEEEFAICAPLIARHMELIAPKLIIIVGGVSLQALTGLTGIMKTRGRWQELDIAGTKTQAMPLYHPAFLLRRPELKKQAWHDLLLIKGKMEGR